MMCEPYVKFVYWLKGYFDSLQNSNITTLSSHEIRIIKGEINNLLNPKKEHPASEKKIEDNSYIL